MGLYQYFMSCHDSSPFCQLRQILWTGNPNGFSDFTDMGVYTVLAVIMVLLSVRVFPVMWKYLAQFFGKRGA